MAKRHKVAVYGTLMAGERNERWAADALGRRPCTLRETLYDTGCGHPAFVPDNAGGYVDVVKSYPILDVAWEFLLRQLENPAPSVILYEFYLF